MAVVARKTYYYLPPHELKRQARHQDEFAQKLYRAVSYGASLRALLWTIIAFSAALGVTLLARSVPWWLSLVAVAALLSAAFSWLPASRVSSIGARVTLAVNPVVVWLVSRLHPVLGRGAEQVQKRYSSYTHTGLFERKDIIELIERQAEQDDSRLSIEELSIVQRALVFGDYLVRDITTPRKQVKTIIATDTVGPILIDELHKFDTPFVLVLDKPKGNIAGCLEIQRLGLQSAGPVGDHMRTPVYYLHESDTLREALHAFFVTNYPVFVVVNSSQEYVGIVTIESILHQLLGHLPGDDFEQYADLPAVASRHPKAAKNSKSTKIINSTDDSIVEVVE